MSQLEPSLQNQIEQILSDDDTNNLLIEYAGGDFDFSIEFNAHHENEPAYNVASLLGGPDQVEQFISNSTLGVSSKGDVYVTFEADPSNDASEHASIMRELAAIADATDENIVNRELRSL
jgi:hypothetical protein